MGVQWVGGSSKSAACESAKNEIAVSQRSNNESAVSEIAVSEGTVSEIAVSACSECDRSECCRAVLSRCAVTLCALSQYSRTVCSRLCTFTLVLSPAKVPRAGTQNSAELATGAARYCQQYTDKLARAVGEQCDLCVQF